MIDEGYKRKGPSLAMMYNNIFLEELRKTTKT